MHAFGAFRCLSGSIMRNVKSVSLFQLRCYDAIGAFRCLSGSITRNVKSVSLFQLRCYAAIHERSRKGHTRYDIDTSEEWLKKPMSEKLSIQYNYLKEQFKLLSEEFKENMKMDPKYISEGTQEIMWKFDSPEACKQWLISADSYWNEGYSTAKFEMSPEGYGLFHGHLDTNIPNIGYIDRAGWVNMAFKCPKKSFGRHNTFDWYMYTNLIMRVRGDGRAYSIILRTPGSLDLSWMDTFSYGLYTHGGPYWQEVRIPFSKFCFSFKGRLQDYQPPVQRDSISEFGITLMDKNTGPFRLEIDYIGLENDPGLKESSAYEMYKVSDFKYPM